VSLLVPVSRERRLCRPARRPSARVGKAAFLLDRVRVRVEDILMAAQDDQLVDQLVRFGGFDALLVCADHKGVSSADDAPGGRVSPVRPTVTVVGHRSDAEHFARATS
jgi:hypothetical protein